MAVTKYKPKRAAYTLSQKVQESARRTAEVVEAAKNAISRSKKAVQTSRDLIGQSGRAGRKQA